MQTTNFIVTSITHSGGMTKPEVHTTHMAIKTGDWDFVSILGRILAEYKDEIAVSCRTGHVIQTIIADGAEGNVFDFHVGGPSVLDNGAVYQCYVIIKNGPTNMSSDDELDVHRLTNRYTDFSMERMSEAEIKEEITFDE